MENQDKLKELNNELEYTEYKNERIVNINNSICNLNNNIEKCISLIEETVKGTEASSIIKTIKEENNNINRINNEYIIEENRYLNTRIKMLNEEQLKLEEQIRKENEE